MKKFIILAVMFMFVASLMTGCTHRLVDFTVISSKNTNIKGKVGKRVKGSDGKCIFMGYANLKEALDRAIEQEPGADALIDGVVYVKNYPYYVKYIVEGTAINTKRK